MSQQLYKKFMNIKIILLATNFTVLHAGYDGYKATIDFIRNKGNRAHERLMKLQELQAEYRDEDLYFVQKNKCIKKISRKYPCLAQFITDNSNYQIDRYIRKEPASVVILDHKMVLYKYDFPKPHDLYIKMSIERVINARKIEKIIKNNNISTFDVAKKTVTFNKFQELVIASFGVDEEKKSNNVFELTNSLTLREIQDFLLIIEKSGFVDFCAGRLNILRCKHTKKLTIIDTEDQSFLTDLDISKYEKYNTAAKLMAYHMTENYYKKHVKALHDSDFFKLKPEVFAYITEEEKRTNLPLINSIRPPHHIVIGGLPATKAIEPDEDYLLKEEYKNYLKNR